MCSGRVSDLSGGNRESSATDDGQSNYVAKKFVVVQIDIIDKAENVTRWE